MNWIAPGNSTDSDGDGVFDWAETLVGLDPDQRDTTGIRDYLPLNHPDRLHEDREVLAEIEAYGALITSQGLWADDWADDGLRKGYYTPARFPYYYLMTDSNVPCHTDHVVALP